MVRRLQVGTLLSFLPALSPASFSYIEVPTSCWRKKFKKTKDGHSTAPLSALTLLSLSLKRTASGPDLVPDFKVTLPWEHTLQGRVTLKSGTRSGPLAVRLSDRDRIGWTRRSVVHFSSITGQKNAMYRCWRGLDRAGMKCSYAKVCLLVLHRVV